MNPLTNPSSHDGPRISHEPSRDGGENVHDWSHVIETNISRIEEALVDCSQCLKIVKDLRPQLLAPSYSEDSSECDPLREKLHREEERHSQTQTLLEKTSIQLERCKRDLDKAETERTAALVRNAEIEALREMLSAKEVEVFDLSTELFQWELRLKDKLREGSSHSETSCKNCNRILLSFAQEIAQVSRRHEDLPQQKLFLLDARRETENVYESKLQEIQSLHKALAEANSTRKDVEDALEAELAHCHEHHTVHSDKSLIPTEQMVKRGAVSQRLDTDNAVNTEPLSHNPAAACIQPDNVPIPDATEPEPVLRRAVGQESNDISNPNTAGPEIMPEQGVSPHLDIAGDGDSTRFVLHHIEGLQLDGILNSNPAAQFDLHGVAGRPSDGNVDVDDAQIVPPSCYRSSSSPLDISGQYTSSNQKLIFLLSAVIAFLAILIQYELGREMPHGNTGLIRPGWARHRKEGWKRKELAGR